MKLIVVGLGYVGLTAAACLADAGNMVFAVDSDSERIAALNKGIVPFKEPRLGDIVLRNLKAGRIEFSGDLKKAILNSDVVFIAVGTPANKKGSQIDSVISSLGGLIDKYKLIVIKSTVPPGTCNQVKSTIRTRAKATFDCISNPEFLRQGTAVKDFRNPARIIIGTDSSHVADTLKQLYKPFIRRKTKVIVMDTVSAELSKYASNAMLAARISFMNELSQLCEKIGADIDHISQTVGSDPRIGADFLDASVGYGGSCLPKDIAALIKFGNNLGCKMTMAKAVQQVNFDQHKRFVQMVVERFKGCQVRLAVWGIAFKAGTDDIRNSPAVYCINKLLKEGFEISAYDPLASANACRVFKDRITITDDRYDIIDGADALVVFTDAPEFKKVDFKRVFGRVKIIFDGRNLFQPADFRQFGIEYHSIGKKCCENF